MYVLTAVKVIIERKKNLPDVTRIGFLALIIRRIRSLENFAENSYHAEW